MRVHLCGVRGSFPTTGAAFLGVGGNTSCVAIAADDGPPTLILDAGTGLTNVTRLLDGQPFVGTILLGHMHWDHVMGLPFFAAGDHPDARVHLRLPEQGVAADELVDRMMSPPLFPIDHRGLRGEWTFSTYGADTFEAGAFTVTAREIPHPGGRTMGLRITDGRSTIAFLSDHAPHDIGPGNDGLGALHPAAVELADGVDVLIHDAQYTAAELPAKATWGHSAAPYCINLARHCGAQRVLLFHHDPSRTDDQVDAVRNELAATAGGIDVGIAREGMTVVL